MAQFTNKQMSVFFTTGAGAPATGLTATISIWEVPTVGAGVLVVNAAAMTEIGGGFYTYNFTSYDYKKKYAVRYDGGATLGSRRYTAAFNTSFYQDIAFGNWEELAGDHLNINTTGGVLNAIRGDTTQILLDVASVQSDTTQIIADVASVQSDTTQIIADVAAVQGDTTQIIADVAAVKGDTTNILADTTQILIDLGSVSALVQTLLQIEVARTKVDTVAKTLTVYDSDCVTPLVVFDLLDSNGNPSVTEVCERKPQTCP